MVLVSNITTTLYNYVNVQFHFKIDAMSANNFVAFLFISSFTKRKEETELFSFFVPIFNGPELFSISWEKKVEENFFDLWANHTSRPALDNNDTFETFVTFVCNKKHRKSEMDQ